MNVGFKEAKTLADRIAGVLRGDDIRHVIEAPTAMTVLEGPAGVPEALEVEDGRGIKHIIRIRPLLALGGPAH